MILAWTWRLGSFLFFRTLTTGGDSRFDEAKRQPLKFFIYWTLQVRHPSTCQNPRITCLGCLGLGVLLAFDLCLGIRSRSIRRTDGCDWNCVLRHRDDLRDDGRSSKVSLQERSTEQRQIHHQRHLELQSLSKLLWRDAGVVGHLLDSCQEPARRRFRLNRESIVCDAVATGRQRHPHSRSTSQGTMGRRFRLHSLQSTHQSPTTNSKAMESISLALCSCKTLDEISLS